MQLKKWAICTFSLLAMHVAMAQDELARKPSLPSAIQLDVQRDFTHLGAGLHPSPATSRKAVYLLATQLRQLDE